MDIKEVLKRENVGRKYGVTGRVGEYTLKLFGEKLQLSNDYNEPIETIMYLEDIVNGDFEEIIDWENLPLDTEILVRDSRTDAWVVRHFAFYKFGKIYCWFDKCTSKDEDCRGAKCWQQAKQRGIL